MAACKRDILTQTGSLSDRHRIVELDALAESGPDSLATIARQLDPNIGTAIITEGLMNYLDPAAASSVWQRIADTPAGFPPRVYLIDVTFNAALHPPAVIPSRPLHNP